MNLDHRLQAVGSFVPKGAVMADIGTDHAYLPVWLLEQGRITSAIAGDIAAGPCQAARNTVATYGMKDRVQVRQGSGLRVLTPGEVDTVTIAGMGASTIISILEEAPAVVASLKTMVLQPMAAASSLRKWLTSHGWQLIGEDLVEDGKHFYEIICAQQGENTTYSEAQYAVGPVLLQEGHRLLPKQLQRQRDNCYKLLQQMEQSEQAKASAKYAQLQALVKELEALHG